VSLTLRMLHTPCTVQDSHKAKLQRHILGRHHWGNSNGHTGSQGHAKTQGNEYCPASAAWAAGPSMGGGGGVIPRKMQKPDLI
jgi:hypothetical protein